MAPDLVLPGHSIHYLDENQDSERVVLLLHGLGATCESWTLQLPALLGAGYRVIAPDARSFGRSTYPGRTSVVEMTRDIISLLTTLNIPQVLIVGISMGGTLALQLALDQPGMVAGLILVNTFATLRPKKLGVWLYFLQRFILIHTIGLEKQAEFVSRRLFPRPEQAALRQELYRQVNQADPAGYRATMRALFRFDVSPRLHEIHQPVLVISGANDTTVPLDVQNSLVSGIVQARQEVVPGAGHAVSVEKPAEFNRLLLDFCLQVFDRN